MPTKFTWDTSNPKTINDIVDKKINTDEYANLLTEFINDTIINKEPYKSLGFSLSVAPKNINADGTGMINISWTNPIAKKGGGAGTAATLPEQIIADMKTANIPLNGIAYGFFTDKEKNVKKPIIYVNIPVTELDKMYEPVKPGEEKKPRQMKADFATAMLAFEKAANQVAAKQKKQLYMMRDNNNSIRVFDAKAGSGDKFIGLELK